MSRPFRFPVAPTSSPLLASLGALLLLGSAAGQAVPSGNGTLGIVQVTGQTELQGSDQTWRPYAGQTTLSSGLRTGTGRAVLGGKSGRVIMGSASRLRVYSQETDFQDGQFLISGEMGAFVLGNHLALSDQGRARVDVGGAVARVAVMAGSLRVSGNGRTTTVTAGQQLNLLTGQLGPFKESDPWYDAQFAGVGTATVEAVRGEVSLRSRAQSPQDVQIGMGLNAEDVLSTGRAAWAEVGFTGGGYLRLTELSELRVLAVEKTARGREVLLQLTKGSAWNVVQKGQGGYKLSTPVVSTAVRGTRFRVDASGTVKVMEGQVAVPSSADAVVSAGQQKQPNQPVQPLQLDDLDRLNEQLDAARAQPMSVQVSGLGKWTSELGLEVKTLPDTALAAALVSRQGPVEVVVSGTSQTGLYTVKAARPLPEGDYTLSVRASRFGQERQWQRTFSVDRTAPQVVWVRAEQIGHAVLLRGRVQDASPRLNLEVQMVGGKRVASVAGTATEKDFRLLLPASQVGGQAGGLKLLITDEAGNRTHAQLP